MLRSFVQNFKFYTGTIVVPSAAVGGDGAAAAQGEGQEYLVAFCSQGMNPDPSQYHMYKL